MPAASTCLSRLAVGGTFAFQLCMLGWAGFQNFYYLNPDGVAYLRLAGYTAAGETSLSVSAYWAPLLSWSMAPLLAAGLSPLATARVAMARATLGNTA